MKVLVTGATGFLGRRLLARLDGDHDLVALVRRPVELGVETAAGDVLDKDALVQAMDGCDVVVHAAGRVSHEPADAQEMWKVHVLGTENVLAACRLAGVKRLVHISSSGTVACSEDADFVATEDSPVPLTLIGSWPYYRSKLFSEQAVLAAEDLEVISINPSLLLGPGDETGGATQTVRYFLEDKLTAIPSGGLSFVDVRDVAEAVAAAVEGDMRGRRYLLGAANMTFEAFYSRLARISNKPPVRLKMPRFTRNVLSFLPELGKDEGLGFGAKIPREEVVMGCHTWYVDSSRARRELGWVPRDPLETLRDTVIDLVNHAGERGHF